MIIDTTEIACQRCGVLFWISSGSQEQLEKTGNPFYCPNGHALHFSRKTVPPKPTIPDPKDKRIERLQILLDEKSRALDDKPEKDTKDILKAITNLDPPSRANGETQNDYNKKVRTFQATIRRVKKLIK